MSARAITRRSWIWVPAVGLTAALTYAVLTTTAALLYPGARLPADTYLSRLGNADLSPDGYLVYNLGMVVCGLLAIPFFVGVAKYYARAASRRTARAGLVIGLVNAVCVIMTGAVAEHVDMAAHIAFTSLLFTSMVSLMIVCGLMLRRLPGFSRVVAWYGFAAAAVALSLLVGVVALGGLHASPGSALEWVAVFVHLSWIVLVSLDVISKRGRRRPSG